MSSKMKISDSVEEMIFSEKAPAFNADEIRKLVYINLPNKNLMTWNCACDDRMVIKYSWFFLSLK